MSQVYTAILVCALVAGGLRIIPIVLLSNRTFPWILQRWLQFLPPALMTAIVAGDMAKHVGRPSFSAFAVAAVLSGGTGYWTRSLITTIVLGVLAYGVTEMVT